MSPLVAAPDVARLLGAAWREHRPLYRGLADALSRLVLDGTLPLHARLPSERDLADALAISRTTTAAAYERLHERGYLDRRRGSGSVTRLPAGATAQGAAHEAPAVRDLAHASLPAPAGALHAAMAAAVEALPRYLPTHGYDPVGLPVLREAIADRYAARGLPTAPDQVLVCNGAVHGLALVLRLLAGQGDRVLVEHPTYPTALDAIGHAAGRAVPVAVTPGGWDVEAIAAAVRQASPRLGYLIADYHNPTGCWMPEPTRVAVAELAARSRTHLVADETLADLGLDDVAPARPLAAYDEAGIVVALGSMSKAFWGGLRIGWVRAPRPLARELAAIRPSIDGGSPVFEQLVSVELLRAGRAALAPRRAALRERRETLIAQLRDLLPAWRFTRPPGGLALWVDLGGPVSSALAVAAQRHGVWIAPGPRFGAGADCQRRLRVPYTLEPAALADAVERLAAAFHAVTGQGPPPSGVA